MYLSSYYSGEGDIIAAPFAFPVLSQIFISCGMGDGDLNLGVGLRLGRGHAGRECCVRNLALTPVTGQTPGLCWEPFGQTDCDNYSRCPWRCTGTYISIYTTRKSHPVLKRLVCIFPLPPPTTICTFRIWMGKGRPRAPCSFTEPYEKSLPSVTSWILAQ